MHTPRTRLRLALIQVRNHSTSLIQEQGCFIERCHVARDQFHFINIAENPGIRWRDVENAHAVIIGGSGSYSVIDDHPFSLPLADVAHELIERDRPLFGVCWGHQFLVKMTGGTVVEDRAQKEIGSFKVTLTDHGLDDPLFAECPSPFWVQLGHKDSVTRLPSPWRELGRSERSPNQAVRLGDKPVYGTQFHCELDTDRLRHRLLVYFDDYVEDEAEHQAILRSLRPSPDADRLLERFLELYA